MSGYRLLHCEACDGNISIGPGEEFQYGHKANGPFCEDCWRWQSQIDVLRERVEVLEKQVAEFVRPNAMKNKKLPSPYDVGAKRGCRHGARCRCGS